MRPVSCLVTNRRILGCDWERAVIDLVRAAAAAGVHLVQIRERDLDARDLLRLVAGSVAAVRGTRTRVLVNDRLDVALAAGAHGLHLPGEGIPSTRARGLAPPGFVIGRSVHRLDEVNQESAAGVVDYLIFGTVFPSASKPGVPGTGVAALAAAASATPVPVLAIGGITQGRLDAVASSGASGFAAISWLADANTDSLRHKLSIAEASFDTLRPE